MQYTTAGGHWFFLPGMYCWQIGKWALPKQDLAQVSLCIRQVARLLRLLHDTFAEVTSLLPSQLAFVGKQHTHDLLQCTQACASPFACTQEGQSLQVSWRCKGNADGEGVSADQGRRCKDLMVCAGIQ